MASFQNSVTISYNNKVKFQLSLPCLFSNLAYLIGTQESRACEEESQDDSTLILYGIRGRKGNSTGLSGFYYYTPQQ